MDNSRILVIPDLHLPYQHIDAIDFLAKLKKTLNPTRTICLGDELDYHALSFHDSDQDLFSAGEELRRAQAYIGSIYELFPHMDVLESNHGSMAYRKAKHHGMPRSLLKSYNEVLGTPDWKWHNKLIVTLPNGRRCMFVHSYGANVLQSSQSLGMSLVQGHHHSQFELRYWQSDYGELHFAITSACLIDDVSYAFAYNKLQVKRPILGVTFIENGMPYLIPMEVNSENRWVGTR